MTLATPALATVVDTATLAGATLLGLVPVALAGLLVLVKWWRGRDEVFDDVTPGVVPDSPDRAPRHRARGGEWSGTVAVRFDPPRGVRPGVVGTLVDGRADAHDVSATLLDLAVRGWFRIRRVPRDGIDAAAAEPHRRADWELERAGRDPDDEPGPFEQALLDRLFEGRTTVRLSTLKGSFGMTMREAQIGLYRAVVDRGWYARHPRARNGRARAVGVVVLVPLALVSGGLLVAGLVGAHDWSLAPLLAGTTAALVVVARWGGSRTPRTATGSAVRIQALGFREYLATAEADRLGFEEKRALLSAWLPYAVAFGLTGHLASVVADIARQSDWADYADALDWWDGSLPLPDDASLGDGLGDVGDGLTDLDLDLDLDMGDLGGLGDLDHLVPDVDAFTGATDSLFSFDGLPGCDGCDGCDLPGCDL